jgi:hypothetical protein
MLGFEETLMKPAIILMSLAVLSSGCTAAMLDRHTVNQAMSVTDMRYQEVMDNLAVVAHNTGTLPSFAINGGGIPQITNTVGVEPKTTWDPIGVMSQTLNAFGKYNPQVLWSFEAVASPAQLAALRYTCLWAVCGPEAIDYEGQEYLRAPRRSDIFPPDPCAKNPQTPSAYPHFDVMHQLEHIPPHWLKCGSRCDVPKCACYKAKCCGTYVWVNPEDLHALSEFTLVIMDIVTRDPASLAAAIPTAQVVLYGQPGIDPCNVDPNAKCTRTDCQCSYDPLKTDCTMTVFGPGTDSNAANLQVTESWRIYQGASNICDGKVFDCEPPQISCKDYIVYTDGFVTHIPYVCKQRGLGNPCRLDPAIVKQMREQATKNVLGLPQFKAFSAETVPETAKPQFETRVQNELEALVRANYPDAFEPLEVPQYVPPAPFGSHAPFPTNPNPNR